MSTKPVSAKTVFKIVFMNQGKVYEIYARGVSHGGLFGFIEVEELLFAQFLPVHQDEIVGYINQFTENTDRLGTVGILFLIVTSILLLDSIESNFNDIWHVRHRGGRLKRLARFWSWVLLSPLLFLASATLKQSLERELLLLPS